MAKIYAPNKQYTGISASVAFVNGTGETDNPVLIKWFKDHGYIIEGEMDTPKEPDKFTGMDADQLKAYATEHDINIGQASSINGILKKIKEVEGASE